MPFALALGISLINVVVEQPAGMRCTPFGPEMPEAASGDGGDAGTSSLVRATQTVRIVKLLRMLKLARVLKASKVLKRLLGELLMTRLELTFASLKV